MGSAVTYYWRTRVDEPLEEWKCDRVIWSSGKTIGDLRRRLTHVTDNDPVLAEKHDVAIIAFDEEGKLLPDKGTCKPHWTPETCPGVFEHNQRPGQCKAFLFFTFPQNKPASQDELVFDMVQQIKQQIETTHKEIKQAIETTHEEMVDNFDKIRLGIQNVSNGIQNVSNIIQHNSEIVKNIGEIIRDTRSVCDNIVEVSGNTARLMARALEFGE